MVKEFWEYSGQPSDEEIQLRKAFDSANHNKLAIRPLCPTCNSRNTMWLRQKWCVCFNCDSSFTSQHDRSLEDQNFWSQFE